MWAKPMGDNGWRSVKLVLHADRDHRANLHLAWNGERFAGGGESEWLAQHRPEALLLAVMALREAQHDGRL
jgi:hypothetical protein